MWVFVGKPLLKRFTGKIFVSKILETAKPFFCLTFVIYIKWQRRMEAMDHGIVTEGRRSTLITSSFCEPAKQKAGGAQEI